MSFQVNNSDSTPSIWVVIANGGVGSRFGKKGPKQYSQVAGKSLFEWTLEQFTQRDNIKGIVISSHANDPFLINQNGLSDSRISLVTGGLSRSESVLNGLRALQVHAAPSDWVLVHDIARPLVRQSDIDALIASCIAHQEGAILASPVPDTLKRANKSLYVAETVSRDFMWGAQTPQCFQIGLLVSAIEKGLRSGLAITDEASAMESQGYPVRIVEGARDNIKVTFPEDLAFAEHVLAGRLK